MQYEFTRGETIVIALDVLSGDGSSVTSTIAKMKPTKLGKLVVDPNAPVAATFVATVRAASGQVPAGWDLTIPSGTSAGIPVGLYVADASLQVAGSVVITDPIIIKIRENVSA